jgi:dTDP-4-dehydrorhamnose reductase
MNKCTHILFFFSLLISQLYSQSEEKSNKVFLVWGGKTGWIGQKIINLLQEQNYTVYSAEARLENREEVENEIKLKSPDYIINCAGVTGTPNVDWCEDHQQQTIRTNIIGALNLADAAYLLGIHVTNFGTGCIYEYDADHPIGSGKGFTEEEEPNFSGSFYSKTKIFLDKLFDSYPNVLNLRLRMPISSDFHSKNFISKITKYQKIINIPNSMSILDDLLPIAIQMTLKELKGKYNFVNPGTISHNELLDLYKLYVDPNFTYTNFTIEEQNKILKARRSNNELDTTKLKKEFPELLPIQQSIHSVFEKMAVQK